MIGFTHAKPVNSHACIETDFAEMRETTLMGADGVLDKGGE